MPLVNKIISLTIHITGRIIFPALKILCLFFFFSKSFSISSTSILYHPRLFFDNTSLQNPQSFPISTFHTYNVDRFVSSKSFDPFFFQILSPSFFTIPIYPQRNETHSPYKNPPTSSNSYVPRVVKKTTFSKPPFRATAVRETHLPRHVLPSFLPPSSLPPARSPEHLSDTRTPTRMGKGLESWVYAMV